MTLSHECANCTNFTNQDVKIKICEIRTIHLQKKQCPLNWGFVPKMKSCNFVILKNKNKENNYIQT